MLRHRDNVQSWRISPESPEMSSYKISLTEPPLVQIGLVARTEHLCRIHHTTINDSSLDVEKEWLQQQPRTQLSRYAAVHIRVRMTIIYVDYSGSLPRDAPLSALRGSTMQMQWTISTGNRVQLW